MKKNLDYLTVILCNKKKTYIVIGFNFYVNFNSFINLTIDKLNCIFFSIFQLRMESVSSSFFITQQLKEFPMNILKTSYLYFKSIYFIAL